jgi:hypothetical protein
LRFDVELRPGELIGHIEALPKKELGTSLQVNTWSSTHSTPFFTKPLAHDHIHPVLPATALAL